MKNYILVFLVTIIVTGSTQQQLPLRLTSISIRNNYRAILFNKSYPDGIPDNIFKKMSVENQQAAKRYTEKEVATYFKYNPETLADMDKILQKFGLSLEIVKNKYALSPDVIKYGFPRSTFDDYLANVFAKEFSLKISTLQAKSGGLSNFFRIGKSYTIEQRFSLRIQKAVIQKLEKVDTAQEAAKLLLLLFTAEDNSPYVRPEARYALLVMKETTREALIKVLAATFKAEKFNFESLPKDATEYQKLAFKIYEMIKDEKVKAMFSSKVSDSKLDASIFEHILSKCISDPNLSEGDLDTYLQEKSQETAVSTTTTRSKTFQVGGSYVGGFIEMQPLPDTLVPDTEVAGF